MIELQVLKDSRKKLREKYEVFPHEGDKTPFKKFDRLDLISTIKERCFLSFKRMLDPSFFKIPLNSSLPGLVEDIIENIKDTDLLMCYPETWMLSVRTVHILLLLASTI